MNLSYLHNSFSFCIRFSKRFFLSRSKRLCCRSLLVIVLIKFAISGRVVLHMAFIYLHTSCHEIQVATNLVPCTLALDITALILRYIHAYLYAKVMFSLWNFNSIAFSANALTRSKRIHEVRNQGAKPLELLALL